MTPLHVQLQLRTPLGTPWSGDTLFGQICHAASERQGSDALTQLLAGYDRGQAWLVVSDAFPAGYLPRPTVPASLQKTSSDPSERKAAKGKRWIPLEQVKAVPSLEKLLSVAVNDEVAYGQGKAPMQAAAFHNTLNRLTGTTGTGIFAPYTQSQIFYAPGQMFDLWCLLDETRLSVDELRAMLEQIGQFGYGRDATVGLGKFEVASFATTSLFSASSPQTSLWWTLAPCAPQGLGLDAERSYWRVMTRFGRHGGVLALGGNPFKQPLLLAATGAVLASKDNTSRQFIGQGLTHVSLAQPAAVHQGYAPVLALCHEE